MLSGVSFAKMDKYGWQHSGEHLWQRQFLFILGFLWWWLEAGEDQGCVMSVHRTVNNPCPKETVI